jgi:hypothetical protein
MHLHRAAHKCTHRGRPQPRSADSIEARLIGRGVETCILINLCDCDSSSRHDSPGRIGNDSGNRTGERLAVSGTGTENSDERNLIIFDIAANSLKANPIAQRLASV